jgi:hypothetical protein
MQIQVSEVVGVGDGHGGFWVRSGTLLDRQEGWDGGWGGGCGGKMISGVGIDTRCQKNEFVLDKNTGSGGWKRQEHNPNSLILTRSVRSGMERFEYYSL